MKLHDALEVHLDLRRPGEPSPETVQVGSLRGSFQGASRVLGSVRFEYAAAYLNNERRIALSPALPLFRGPQYLEADGLLPDVFSDTAPDDWGQSVIREEVSRAQPGVQLGPFDFLSLTSDSTRMGALRYQDSSGSWLAPSVQPLPETPGDWTDNVSRYIGAAHRFEQWEATEADMMLLGAAGSTLGGARPKVVIERDGSLWLLKLPSNRDQRTDTEAWEALALDLAHLSDIRVPRHTLVHSSKGGSALMIERFDRRSDHRLHYISAQTALGAGPGTSETYEDLADALEMLAAPRGDLQELFVRIAFNVLISNRDDHWRNHGFIFDQGWRLSPAFDLNPVRASSPIRSRPINKMDDPTDRNIAHLLDACATYALTTAQAAEMLAPLVDTIPRWREIALRRKISEQEIESMASAFRDDQFEMVKAFVEKHHS